MSLDHDIQQLSANPIFAQLSFDARRLLAFSAETKILRAGDLLFQKGDRADGAYFISKGAVILDYAKNKERAVQIFGPLHLIGEMALLAETQRPATAIAREPTTVFKISRSLFLRILEEYPDSADSIRRSMLANLTQFIAELKQSPSFANSGQNRLPST